LRGTVIANAPFTSVVVAYFFPVSVLLAVTATPGNGTAPAFTVPEIAPPFASLAAGVVAVGTGVVAVVAGVPDVLCASAGAGG
jgi:hypothetical protein